MSQNPSQNAVGQSNAKPATAPTGDADAPTSVKGIPPGVTVDQEAHKEPDDAEQVYYEGRPLLRGEIMRCFIFWFIGFVCLISPFLYRWATGSFPGAWMWLAGLLLAVVFGSIPIIDTRKTRYRITNYRIDFERGILSRSIDTLELWHVEDIKLHQSILDRIFGVGTIIVMSHDDTTPELEIEGVMNPRPLFEMMKQRIIAVKRQRGVLKVDTGR